MTKVERFRNKKVLIVGLGKTGFSLIKFFNHLDCEIRVTDLRPIFDLNKAVKRLRKVSPTPQMTFGEHRDEDFLDADVVVYSSSVNPDLPQLILAKRHGKEVYSEFALANRLCKRPIIAVCGAYGRTSVAYMIGYGLKLDGKNVFVGGTDDSPFIDIWEHPNKEDLDYVVVEVSVLQMDRLEDFYPHLIVYTGIDESSYPKDRFRTVGEYFETQLSILKNATPHNFIIANYDKLGGNSFFHKLQSRVYWYSRKSFLKLGVIKEISGTHFHERRIHSSIHTHSEFSVKKMRLVGEHNRENLLAAITVLKALKISDKSIQTTIEKFPGIPHRLEFVLEKNAVRFYNDSKSEDTEGLKEALKAFKGSIILIAGGKENDQDYDDCFDTVESQVRVMALVGESKEKMNRILGDAVQTYLVGSFEESVLIAYQKSRTGDIILLSPGNPSTDVFRDYKERGNYFKKLVYQL